MSEGTIADKIDSGKLDQYLLSIRLGMEVFSFSIHNPIRDNVILFREWEINRELSLITNIKQVFKELEFLGYAYKKVNVQIINRRFTLTPLDLFEESQAESFFYYNYFSKENEIVLYNVLPKIGIVLLFGMDKGLYDFFNDRYANVQFYSSISSLAEYFFFKSRVGNTKKMYVLVRSEFMELYCYERGHMLLLNTYDCDNTADRLYYLLYTWKLLAMDQQRDELFLSGDLIEKDKLVADLKRFVRCVYICSDIELNKL